MAKSYKKIDTYHITTGMGKYLGELPFLTKAELEEFNSIGYSGKTHEGLSISREDYLNCLGKGEFQVTQTKFDDGSFKEAFTIVWVR